MPLVHRDMPGLHNGVSQQAPALRLPNQLDRQENLVSDVAAGLEKRQGTKFVATLPGSRMDLYSYAFLFRDSEGVEYGVYVTGDDETPLEVYRLSDGKACQITYQGDAKKYLTNRKTTFARDDYRIAAISDYALVINRNVVCRMSAERTPEQSRYALYWVKKGLTSTTYTLSDWFAGTTLQAYSHTTAAGTTTTNSDSQAICKAMAGGVGPLTQLAGSSVARLTGASVDKAVCSDSYGDQASVLLKGRCAKEEDLPPHALDGDVMEITGSGDTTYAGYYVRYSVDKGSWNECVAPGAEYKFDASTMPHQLIRHAPLHFVFRAAEKDAELNYPGWEPREAGDDTSCPLPSFIGHTLRDIFYYKNRLAVLSGGNEILTKPNDYFNFFPDSAVTSLDTDPIDRAVGFNEPVLLEWAVPYKEDLLLFSKSKQFIMSTGLEVFTASNAMIDLITTYPTSTLARPVNLGTSVVFLSDNGDYSLVREYFIDSSTMQHSDADITAHCPRYVPAKISRTALLANKGMLLCWSELAPKNLSAYCYFWSGDEKPQSAWSTYTFPFEILTMLQCDEIVHLIVRQDGVTRLERLDLAAEDLLHMDSRFEATALTYNATLNRTRIPYAFSCETRMTPVVTFADGRIYPGLTVVASDANSVTVAGDITDGVVVCGLPFTSVFKLSEFFLSTDGRAGELQGRLQVRNTLLSFRETGAFRIEVGSGSRLAMTHHYSAVRLGDAALSRASLRSERKKFMTPGDSRNLTVTVYDESVLPSSFDSFSFEALYQARTQRT